jgi:pentatricopeptide repeat protein
MKPKTHIFNHPIIQLLQKCKNLNTLKQIHAKIITNSLSFQTYCLSHLINISSNFDLTYAFTIFNYIPNPTIFLYNTLISSLINQSNQNNILLAFSLYNKILTNKNLQPNSFTFPSLFKACCFNPSWFQYGPLLHTHVLKFLLPPFDNFVQASLLNFYAKYGKLCVSRYIFDQINDPDLATWNIILSAYANNVNYHSYSNSFDDVNFSLEALYLFNDMQVNKIRPNEVTFVALIRACSNLGALSQGFWVHCFVLKNKIKVNRFVGTALIDMYSKCGFLNFACQLFDKMPENDRDAFCYTAMIGGFALHGYGNQALELYRKMKFNGLVPDDATFVVTMFACSHGGLVEEGLEIFESMKEVHGVQPKLEHYGCLIDLLGRAGRLKEAEERLQGMAMKPNAVLWRSLLGAARLHGNFDVGEVALRKLIELEPETSGNYVLLSNMYATVGRWNDVKRVRMLMKHHGVNKLPGFSLVEINGAMHEFLTGDKTHPFSKEIYLKIAEINRRLQEYGYNARTSEVLFDVEDEDKEGVLSYHSERLAIAFALIASPSGLAIRIIKNLRVCGDCHAFTKLISVAYRRDIIVRDRNRFHHFKDGSCSCLDYW